MGFLEALVKMQYLASKLRQFALGVASTDIFKNAIHFQELLYQQKPIYVTSHYARPTSSGMYRRECGPWRVGMRLRVQ